MPRSRPQTVPARPGGGRKLVLRALVTSVSLWLGACATDDDDDASGETADAAPQKTADGPIPTETDALLEWLSGYGYLDWPAESSLHASAGPHFGNVRTWVDDSLFASLDAGNAEHPLGAAAVKELYGNGTTLQGWSVEIKIQDDSAGGEGWRWLEVFDDSTIADGIGTMLCTGCHAQGIDFVRVPFPLQ